MKNSTQIHQVLLLVLPSLTSFNPEQFSQLNNYVNELVYYLLSCTRNNMLKSLAYISLGTWPYHRAV